MDRFEAETAEIPALTDEDLRISRMTRKTPVLGHTLVTTTTMPCTDPAYVGYLERQLVAAHEALQIARAEAESARAAALAAGAHNADLVEQVRKLAEELAELKISRT